ncbi:MAG: hypothetical protein L0Z49_11980 [Actinobacteria bacterium]|nr:hypothetical protein [Actinomycetota bacterium]
MQFELRHDQLSPTINGRGRTHSTDLDYLYQYGIFKVRVEVHHDRTYAQQSWAKVSVWRDRAWSTMATYHYSLWAREIICNHEWGTEGICLAHDALLNQARLVLG